MRLVSDDHDRLAVQAGERLVERSDRLVDDALLVGGDVEHERVGRLGRRIHREDRDVGILRRRHDGPDRPLVGVAVEDGVGALADRALDCGVHLLEVEVALDHGQIPAELVGLRLDGLDPPGADRRLVAGGEGDDPERLVAAAAGAAAPVRRAGRAAGQSERAAAAIAARALNFVRT